jgi:hypothetical protein
VKKLKMFLFGLTAFVLLTGCVSEDDDYYDDGLTTLFLVDKDGYSLAGVGYICDSMQYVAYTPSNGEFSFYPGENCDFDLSGLDGNLGGDPFEDDIVYIVDNIDNGKGGIGYSCELFGVGVTQYDGSFYYEQDDKCVFRL